MTDPGISGGASIYQSTDKRVTRVIDWVLAAIGSAMLLLMWRAGDALVELKVGMATLTERVNAKDKRDDLQDKRLDVLEGRTFRGVDGYGPAEKRGQRDATR